MSTAPRWRKGSPYRSDRRAAAWRGPPSPEGRFFACWYDLDGNARGFDEGCSTLRNARSIASREANKRIAAEAAARAALRAPVPWVCDVLWCSTVAVKANGPEGLCGDHGGADHPDGAQA